MPYHFILVDTNINYYNCGHYPEWEVTKVNEQMPAVNGHRNRWNNWVKMAFATRQEACDECMRRNLASNQRWRDFLAC